MLKQKKILIIHHSGYIGGAGVSLLHILKAMKDLNLDVAVYCPDKPNAMKKEISKLGYEFVSGPQFIPIIEHYSGSNRSFIDYKTLRNIFTIIINLKHVRNMIRKSHPDIVIVNSMTLSYIGKIAKSMNIESICFHRETYTKGLFGVRTKIIKSQLSKDFDKVIYISKYDLAESGKLKSCSYVITDKVILDDYRENLMNSKLLPQLDNKIIKVLYTGGMSKLKGAHILIKALAKSNKNVHLLFLQYDDEKKKKRITDYKTVKDKIKYIIGKDYTANILAIIEKNNLWDRVHFYPTTTLVAPFMIDCDIVVFPSTSPHQARPIYEAGAAKKPIIITKSQNIAEFVVDGENGLVFDPDDYNALASAINRLAVNETLREKLGQENYLRTITNHNFNKLRIELKNAFDL